MNLTDRDRRALLLLAVAGAIMAALYFWPEPSVEVVGTGAGDSASAAARLDRVRREAALVKLRQEELTREQAALAAQEKGLIAADSAAQAQAQLLQIVRRVARAQSPPIEIRQSNFGPVRPFDSQYAQVTLGIGIECQIEQLVNLLSDFASQPELLALEDLRISQTSNKQKSIPVQMTIAGLTRGSLAPASARVAGGGL
jgi:hypothetical protein